MKKLSILFVALLFTATAWAQRETSAGHTKTKNDFGKYKTFTWAKSDPTAVGSTGYEIYYYEFSPERPDPRKNMRTPGQPPYFYSYTAIIPARDQATNEVIKDAISNELEGRGYRENDPSGDLIVVYQVFDQRAQLHGYSTSDGTPQQATDTSDTTTFILEPGSLMISLIDAKTSEMVWNGFSSGLVNNSAFTTDEADIKESIHTIFENFRHTADRAKRY